MLCGEPERGVESGAPGPVLSGNRMSVQKAGKPVKMHIRPDMQRPVNPCQGLGKRQYPLFSKIQRIFQLVPGKGYERIIKVDDQGTAVSFIPGILNDICGNLEKVISSGSIDRGLNQRLFQVDQVGSPVR